MARTLDARHTEEPETSGLFNLFLLIVLIVMGMALLGSVASAESGRLVEVPPAIQY